MGLELDTQIRLGRGFELSGGLGLLHSEITDAGAVLARFQGQELPRAPGVTGALGLTYRAGNGFEAGASIPVWSARPHPGWASGRSTPTPCLI